MSTSISPGEAWSCSIRKLAFVRYRWAASTMRVVLVASTVFCAPALCNGTSAAATTAADVNGTFVNPLLPTGADPWVTYRDGWYYYMCSTQTNLTIWKTRNIADLSNAEKKVVWQPPAEGPWSHDIWAPELHFLQGKWYIYFAADAGTNETHRIWVLENALADPLQGKWTMKGKLADPSDRWAIDATVFDNAGKIYAIWSGWEGDANGVQSLYIAELENPWTIKGHRVRISTPEFPWEKVGDNPSGNRRDPEKNPASDPENPLHIDVNEGPEVLQHGDYIFVVYSGSACWVDFYALGMLTAPVNGDLLDSRSWKKSPTAQFWQSPSARAFGTGHNGFFKSPDGKEDWIIYHANSEPNQGCGSHRAPRAQPFSWNADGTPAFGRPVPAGQPLPRPSGEGR